MSRFQIHTVVSDAYIENVSRNTITVCVLNYDTHTQVHSHNDVARRKQQLRCNAELITWMGANVRWGLG